MRQAVRDAKVRERFDTPLAIIAGFGALALMGLGYFTSLALDLAGAFDPYVVRPLPDARILTNLRDSDAPFVAGATLSDGEGSVVLLREDGQLIHFDEPTGLVSHAVIDPIAEGLQSELLALSAGCGRSLVGDAATPCPEPNRLYGLSENGGIIESDTGRDWRVRLRDSPWQGRDGKPVKQSDVTAWASSADGRYIAVLAGAKGLAVFDQQTDHWDIVGGIELLMTDEALGAPIHLLSHDNTFWFGSSQGLAQVSLRAQSPQLDWTADTGMSVRDLTVTAQGDLVALLSGACSQGSPSDCLSIEKVNGLDQRVILVGEIEKIATMSDDTIRHAVLQGTKIVVVDQAGLFSYDQTRRTWETLTFGTVDAFWVNAQDGDVTATMSDKLVQVSAGRVSLRRQLEGGPFVQLEVTSAGRILGLGRNGELRDLKNNKILASRDGTPPDDTVFHAGTALGDRVLLVSRTGVLVHDVRARQFLWLDVAALSPNASHLNNQEIELRTAGDAIWLINRRTGMVSSVSMIGSFPDIVVSVSDPAMFSGPLRSIMAAQSGLFIVDSQGIGAAVAPSRERPRVQPLVGDPRNGRGAFTTAASHRDGVLFATASRIWNYDLQSRGWQAPFDPPQQEKIADIGLSNGLYLLSQSKRLYRKVDQSWDLLLGDGADAQLGLDDVTDASSAGSTLYFGGRGVVQTYNLDTSAFGVTYGGGRGDVRLVDVTLDHPVWLSNAQLRYGDTVMENTGVLGAWAARDGIVALVNGKGNRRFAMHWRTPSAEPVCTFMSAPAPQGDTIDAVELASGRLLVATKSDVGIYDTEQRRWLTVTGLTPTPELRLYVSAGHLVAVTERRILSLPLANIAERASCEAPSLPLNWTQDESAQNVVFDEQREQGIILADGGRVSIWENGAVRQVLARANQGPEQATLQQVVASSGSFIFAARERIWEYDLLTRLWSSTQIVMPNGAAPIAEVDISGLRMGRAEVTIWTRDKASYQGSWTSGATNVEMASITVPTMVPLKINTPAHHILDISSDGEIWMIASDFEIEFTKSGQIAPLGKLSFPQLPGLSKTPNQLGTNGAFIVGDAAAPERLFILPVGASLTDQSGALPAVTYDYTVGTDRAWGLSLNGQILLRVDQDGAVLSCDIVSGAKVPSGCQQTFAPPLEIDRESVGIMFEDADNTYVALRGALNLLDASRRNQILINGPAVRDDAVAFDFDDEVFLWEGEGNDLWRIREASAVLVLRDVQRIDDSADVLTLGATSGLFQMRSASGVPENLSQSIGLNALTFDWQRGGALVGIDDSGMVRSVLGELMFPEPIPSPNTITSVFQPRDGWVWTQRSDGSVTTYVTKPCSKQNGPLVWIEICLNEVRGAHFPNPSGEPLTSVSRDPSPLVQFVSFAVPFDGNAFGEERNVSNRLPLNGNLANDRRRFLNQILVGPTGVTELAPAVLESNGRRISYGVRGSSVAVARDFRPSDALDLGWLKWDRAASTFEVAGAGGNDISVSPQQFIRNGTPLLNHSGVARSVYNGAGFDWITPHSIWRLVPGDGPPALVSLIDLPEPVGLEAGRLLFAGNQGLAVGAEVIDVDVNATRTASGVLTLQSNWRARRVDGVITRTENSQLAAFGARGFIHDRRDLVGWMQAGPVVSTGVGLVSPLNFAAVLPRPNGTTPDRLLHVNGQGLARKGGVWSTYDQGTASWLEVNDPFVRRILASMDGVIWRLDQGALNISTTDAALNESLARNGLQFDGDRLRAMAASPGAVILATGLGTHQFDTAAELSFRGGADDAITPQEKFDALSISPNDWVLFAGNGRAVWDQTTRTWTSPTAARAPWSARRAVSIPEIQLDLSARVAPVARRAVRNIDGTQRFARFEWGRGDIMPFDRANAIHTDGGTVYVGTNMGMRLIGASPSRSDVFVDARPIPARDDRRVAPVSRVGHPFADDSRLLARDTAGNCLEVLGTTQFRVCTNSAAIDQLFVVSSDLWNWSKTSSGLSGAYPMAKGAVRRISNDPSPRWPHDSLVVYGVCGGAQIEIWDDGTTIREAGVTSDLGAVPRVSGHCQPRNINIAANITLDSGLYLLAARAMDVLEHISPSNWGPVNPQLYAPINRRAQATWAFEAERLRLRAQGAVANAYEFRRLDGKWSTMEWSRGLPVMDETRAVLSDGGLALRVTPMGVMEQTLTARALEVDPNSVVFRTTSDPRDFASCAPDREARLDGRAHTLTAQTGAPIVLRCRDGRILQDDPRSTQDAGAFTIVEQDPFAARVAIDQADGWRWSLEDDRIGSNPSVAVAFRDEAVSLAAGRFDLDDYRSLAAPFAGRMSIVSGLGLWEHSASNLALDHGQRPEDISNSANVTGVFGDRDQSDGTPVLCVDRSENLSVVYTVDARPRQVEACYAWRGQDALFQYRHNAKTGAQALALAANGPLIKREIAVGQFTDRVAIGAPQPVQGTRDLIVPTAFGASLLNENGQTGAVYSHADILGVATLPDTGTSILTRSGVFPVANPTTVSPANCPSLPQVLVQIPQDHTVQSITVRGSNWVHFLGTGPNGAFLASAHCEDDRLLVASQEFIVSGRIRHIAVLSDLEGDTQTILVKQETDGRLVLTYGRSRQLPLGGVSGRLIGVYAASQPRAAVILTDEDAYLLDMDAAISALSDTDMASTFVAPIEARSFVDKLDLFSISQQSSEPPPGQPVQYLNQIGSVSATLAVADVKADAMVDLSAANRVTVVEVQTRLKLLGYYSGRIDGDPGPLSRAAISAFQSKIGVPETGSLTQQQYEQLMER
ncbi:MAG: hypothetical protein HOL77_10720 [Rhodobacteraceae bacterium]|nr:hypothetical protein [Paracoccaceae bacterium]